MPTCAKRRPVAIDDLIDFTPALRAEAIEAVTVCARLGAFMAPPLCGQRGRLEGNAFHRGVWKLEAADPGWELGSMTNLSVLSLAPSPPTDIPYGFGGGNAPTVQGLPAAALWQDLRDGLKTGQLAWTIANADTPAVAARA